MIPPEVAPSSAHARILEMRRELEEARATAILDPSPAHVSAYLRLQQAALQKSAVVFRQLPAHCLGDAGARLHAAPSGRGARQAGLVGPAAGRAATRRSRDLGERYGLIYLGDASCAGCRVFGPLLRAFAYSATVSTCWRSR